MLFVYVGATFMLLNYYVCGMLNVMVYIALVGVYGCERVLHEESVSV